VKRLKIALLLHFYQPWWQFPWIIKKIVNECYRPILGLIEELDCFCFTININLSLLLHLEEHYPDVIEGLKRAVQTGKLEIVGSTAQHPIMPLIPEFVQRAQIEEDRIQKENRFGIRHNCGGFFFPEMAFSTKCVDLLKSYGYSWTVVDDEPFVAHYGKSAVPFNSIVSWNGFRVFMRSNYWSNTISHGNISFSELKSKMEVEIPNWTGNAPAYIVIAMDAETFGHHDRKRGADLMGGLLVPMLKEWVGNVLVPIESLVSDFPEIKFNYLPKGSWSTSVDDIRRDNPYPLWSSKISLDRYRLWRLVNLALTHFDQARDECLKMTSSCHWWWISRSGWDPKLMQKGAKLAYSVLTDDEKMSIQEDFDELMALKEAYVHKDVE